MNIGVFSLFPADGVAPAPKGKRSAVAEEVRTPLTVIPDVINRPRIMQPELAWHGK